MKNKCDLHTHSIFSDGTKSPLEIVEQAVATGLSAIALTDHNTTTGLPDFTKAAKEHNIPYAAGVEFSTDFNNKELHIVGLFIDPEHYETTRTFIKTAYLAKVESNKALIAALAADGYHLDFEKIKNSTPNGFFNRVHFAENLVEKGYCSSVKEAFKTLLSPENKYYNPPKRLDSLATIDFIKSINGISVLAHPLLSVNKEELTSFLEVACPQGLDAMETHYSEYTPQMTEKAVALANQFNLLPSGGSDFHGDNKPNIMLGTGLGNLAVPFEFFSNMEKLKKQRSHI